MSQAVVITGLGLVSALGADPAEVAAAVEAERSGVAPHPALAPLGDDRAGVVSGPDLRRWLKRRKDLKLMARPAVLALAAAGPALGDWPGDRAELGLYLAVGREPPDQGDAEPCLAASASGGALDEARLASAGRALYPPLLPLQTLPNMALAHVSINLEICGENGAWAGGVEAGWTALQAAFWAVAEGRVPAALVGGADSLVDLGSARDRLRMGAAGAPGEAAALLLLEPAAAAAARGATALGWLAPGGLEAAAASAATARLRASLGDCGAAEAALLLGLALAGARSGRAKGDLNGAALAVPGLRLGPGSREPLPQVLRGTDRANLPPDLPESPPRPGARRPATDPWEP